MIYYNTSMSAKRPVMKCDAVSPKTLKIYESVTAAAEDNECSVGDICKVADRKDGRKTCAGFVWRWKPLQTPEQVNKQL